MSWGWDPTASWAAGSSGFCGRWGCSAGSRRASTIVVRWPACRAHEEAEMRGLKSDLWIAVLALVAAISAVWVILVAQGYSLTGVVWTSVLGLGALATVLRWGRASA